MRKSIYLFGAFMSVLLLASCSSIRVFTDYDIEVDFTNYSSFAFYKPSIDQAEISDLDKRRILKSIESQMTAKGYVLAENADLLVSIATDEESRVDINNQTWGFGWGWGFNPWMWSPMNNQTVSTYDRGVLLIDILDTDKKQLIWQGKGSGILTNVTNPEGRQKLIDRYVSAILAKYPIR
jgi:hypothetical protein